MKIRYFLLLLLAGASFTLMGFRPNQEATTATADDGSYVYFHTSGSKAKGNYLTHYYFSEIVWIEGDRYGETFKKNRIRYENKFKSEIISDHDDEADYVYMTTMPSYKDKDGFELEREKEIKSRKEKKYTVNQIYL